MAAIPGFFFDGDVINCTHATVQFITSPSKRGAGSDVTFTPFISNNVGDAYVTPEQRRRAYEKEKKEKMIVPQPFRPSSPTQKGSGHGTFLQYGNFGSFPYMKTTQDADGKTIRKPLAPRNFLTSPPKKGTYGMVGINIGGKVDGVVGEFTYSSNPPPPKTRPNTTDMVRFSPSSPAKRGTYGIHHTIIPLAPLDTHKLLSDHNDYYETRIHPRTHLKSRHT